MLKVNTTNELPSIYRNSSEKYSLADSEIYSLAGSKMYLKRRYIKHRFNALIVDQTPPIRTYKLIKVRYKPST